MARKNSQKRRANPSEEAQIEGWNRLRNNPLFGFAMRSTYWNSLENHPGDGWATVSQVGRIIVNRNRRGAPEEWEWVYAHCLLHLCLDHFKEHDHPLAWEAACDVVVTSFLSDAKVGIRPLRQEVDLPRGSEEELYRKFVAEGIPPGVDRLGVGGAAGDMKFEKLSYWATQSGWSAAFAAGLRKAVAEAVEQASGISGESSNANSPAKRARSWFAASFPLLGALATGMKVIEDIAQCQSYGISVAAVNPVEGEIFYNSLSQLNDEELRFVMAHELLHVGLCHHARCEGRDPYLWNVACDYVINGWLVEMQVGSVPRLGCLYDEEFKGVSAEEVYDRIVRDLRRFRKLSTFRGINLGDILVDPSHGPRGLGTDLDEWYRSCLLQGLDLEHRYGRGLIPASLVAEIRALAVPPIPWDVRLAQWLDGYFQPLEPTRTFARASRRQSSTPEIPRPSLVKPEIPITLRTFGVVLDTSGSMNHELLGKALGAIASYAVSRDVPAVRVVFCDAAAYDAGYMVADDIAGRVKVRGRGGTILQPGIDVLERAEDFPKDGPILIITDGMCDTFRVRRDHAVLTPLGARLPFTPTGPVFRME